MIVAKPRTSFDADSPLIHSPIQLTPPPQAILQFDRTYGGSDHAFKYQLERFLRLIAQFELE